jgi:hypothetical protein
MSWLLGVGVEKVVPGSSPLVERDSVGGGGGKIFLRGWNCMNGC